MLMRKELTTKQWNKIMQQHLLYVETNGDEGKPMRLIGVDLTGVEMESMDLRDAVFCRCDLSYSIFRECSFERVKVTNCNLWKAAFEQCVFDQASFKHSDLQMANFRTSLFHLTTLEQADLEDVKKSLFNYFEIYPEKLPGLIGQLEEGTYLHKPFVNQLFDSFLSNIEEGDQLENPFVELVVKWLKELQLELILKIKKRSA